MLKMLKKCFKRRTVVSNQRGNLLSTGIVIMAVMALSITTITAMTSNVSKQTDMKMETMSNENEGKTLINQSISEFEEYIAYSGVNFTTFESTEVPRIYNDYKVTVTDVTTELLGNASNNGITSKAYKFSFVLNTGETLYKYGYVSSAGSTLANINPYDYQISSNGDVILNGGYYYESWIFGDNVRISDQSPFFTANYGTQAVTTANDKNYPQFTVERGWQYEDYVAQIHYNDTYTYCYSGCYPTNSTDTFTITENYFSNVEGSNLSDPGDIYNEEMLDFFGNYNYRDWVVEYIQTTAPKDDYELTASLTWDTLETVIMQNSTEPTELETDWWDSYDWWNDEYWVEVFLDYLGGWWNGFFHSHGKNNNGKNGGGNTTYQWDTYWGQISSGLQWPDDDFVDITNYIEDVNLDTDFLQFGQTSLSMVYQGTVGDDNPLTLSSDIYVPEDESFIVIDDLVLDSDDWYNLYQEVTGTVVVFGDLYLTGDSKYLDGTFIVFGETYVDLNYNEGIYTPSNNGGLSIIAQDNIHFISNFQSNYSSWDVEEINAFIYTEESVYIDAVNSRLSVYGSIFARAENNQDVIGDNDIKYVDENNDLISGIVINSYQGYVYGDGDVNPRWNQDWANRFKMYWIDLDHYDDYFTNIPQFEPLIQAAEEGLTFERGEFATETETE
jgi:hypothetical protein